MKSIFKNKYVLAAIGLLVVAALFIVGKHEEAGTSLATVGLVGSVELTAAEKEGMNDAEQKMLLAVKKMVKQVEEKVSTGAITKDEVGLLITGVKDSLTNGEIKALREELSALDAAAKAQGTSMQQVLAKLNSSEVGNKSISQVLKENEEKLKNVFKNGVGTVDFLIQVNDKGEFVATPYDRVSKAAGPHGSIADIGGVGNTSSIAQSLNAQTLLRLGGDAPIISQYRNNPWVFDLCNLVTTSMDQQFAMWYDEQVKQGASATVAEGGTKPLSQYAYTLQSSAYKKEATLLTFTDEFNMDFARLQADILGKGRVDLINRINTAVLANIITAATAYNTGTAYKNGAALSTTNYNDYITIDAAAAQVDAATFGGVTNAAVMSTYKRHRIGVTMDAQGGFLQPPASLAGVAMVGNPGMATDDLLVGDFKQYNILLRGGMILKVGYNGTDFASNQFSVVLEQYYFDYISSIRAKAIVKGQTFAIIKTAITT